MSLIFPLKCSLYAHTECMDHMYQNYKHYDVSLGLTESIIQSGVNQTKITTIIYEMIGRNVSILFISSRYYFYLCLQSETKNGGFSGLFLNVVINSTLPFRF